MDSILCPHCSAPKIAGPECPRCGVIYVRAEAHGARALLAPQAVAHEVPDPPSEAKWQGDLDDARIELKIRAFAIPVALVLAWLIAHSQMLHALMRIFLSMWVHELGHATTAWLCGFGAFPGPWVTPISESRVPLVSILLLGALGYISYRAWQMRRWNQIGVAGGLLLLHACMTLGLSSERAQALILFGGDGGCMVIGTLLMASVYAKPESAIHRGWLRWGFLVIGSAAFADSFETWWSARTDPDRIPFGMNEGAGLSDPSRLVENHGWTEHLLVQRYVVLGLACLVGLFALYAVKLLRARAEVSHSASDH